jgi:mediator of RNA polymerase II transcription subunit 14
MLRRPNGFDDPPIKLLEAELPSVDHDQVSLRGLVSRLVQACYVEMTEMVETSVVLFNSSHMKYPVDG